MTPPARLPINPAHVVLAAQHFIDTCHSAFTEDLAESMTCTEADALAELYLALHIDPTSMLAAHAYSDDEGDDHYPPREDI